MSNTVVHDGVADRRPVLDDLRPDLELLRWLVRGSFKQNLLRSIRLWVWLRWLYASNRTMPDPFTFANCRDLFFSASHPKGEHVPDLHDPLCPCARTAAQWLFNGQTGLSEPEWRQDLQQYEAILNPDLTRALNSRLFAVTRRSLAADLHELARLGWLEYSERDRHYRRVVQLPAYPAATPLMRLTSTQAIDLLPFLHPDLGAIAQNHAGHVRGIQRFFLHLDYIIPSHKLDQVDDWQDVLRQVWQEDPVNPLQLVYQSARHQTTLITIVYPVCIYYAQRSVYLCGFNPELPHQWYNFRLDRIQQCDILNWTDARIPPALNLCYQNKKLPDPAYIQMQLEQAWGFDFYLPSRQLVLRFNRDFHDRYVKDTFRHATFEAIDRVGVAQAVRESATKTEQKTVLHVLKSRPLQDVYYQVCYRDGDTNIRHRLRAWRPHVEVLLPWSLRREIAAEVETEFQFYQED